MCPKLDSLIGPKMGKFTVQCLSFEYVVPLGVQTQNILCVRQV